MPRDPNDIYKLPRPLPPPLRQPRGKRGSKVAATVGVFASTGILLGTIAILGHMGANTWVLCALAFGGIVWVTMAAEAIDGGWA